MLARALKRSGATQRRIAVSPPHRFGDLAHTEDVEFLDHLGGIFDVPASLRKLMVDELRPGLCLGLGHELPPFSIQPFTLHGLAYLGQISPSIRW